MSVHSCKVPFLSICAFVFLLKMVNVCVIICLIFRKIFLEILVFFYIDINLRDPLLDFFFTFNKFRLVLFILYTKNVMHFPVLIR